MAFRIYQAYLLEVLCITLILASGSKLGFGIHTSPISAIPMSPSVTCFQDEPCKTNEECNKNCISKGYKDGGFCGGNVPAGPRFCCCTKYMNE